MLRASSRDIAEVTDELLTRFRLIDLLRDDDDERMMYDRIDERYEQKCEEHYDHHPWLIFHGDLSM